MALCREHAIKQLLPCHHDAAIMVKKVTCLRCGEEKPASGHFKKNTLTCNTCLDGVDRVCESCQEFKAAADFLKGWKKCCLACNEHKDTAEHVDACECGTVFSRNPDTFTWRSRPCNSNWNNKCKACCAFRGYELPTQCSGPCGQVKDPAEFNRPGECKSCRSERTKQETAARGARVTAATTPKPRQCSNEACGKPFEESAWRAYREGEGRWDSQCRDCFNAKQYWKTYRERKLEEDAEGFRARNNASLRAWRSANPTKQANLQLRQKITPEAIFQRWTRQAEQRGLSVAPDEKEQLCFHATIAATTHLMDGR